MPYNLRFAHYEMLRLVRHSLEEMAPPPLPMKRGSMLLPFHTQSLLGRTVAVCLVSDPTPAPLSDWISQLRHHETQALVMRNRMIEKHYDGPWLRTDGLDY